MFRTFSQYIQKNTPKKRKRDEEEATRSSKLSHVENVTQGMMREFKEHHFTSDLNFQQKKVIKRWVDSILTQLNNLAPADAVDVLSEAEKHDIHHLYKKHPLFPLIEKIHNKLKDSKQLFNFSSKYTVSEYVQILVHRKILQLALNNDIIKSAYLAHTEVKQISDLMNIVSRSIRFLKKDAYYFEKTYRDEQIDTLHYLLVDKKLPLAQAISEVRDLNDYQAEALKELYDNNLRGRDLRLFRKDSEKEAYFSFQHRNALKYFIKNNHFPPEKAMAEIDGLSSEQVEALMDMFNIGIRGDYLRNWEPGKYSVFRHTQAETIKYLITEQHLSPKKAVEEINELTYPCCQALQALYAFGLRGTHFRQKKMIEHFNGSDDLSLKALTSLVRDQHVPVEIALDELKKIEDQAWYVITLGKVYHLGLRADDFRHYKSAWVRDNNFTKDHSETICYLMEKQDFASSDAVKEVSKLTSNAAYAVKEFFKLGLRGSDLRDWNYNGDFNHEHQRTLAIFVKEGMPISKALDRLKRMTSYEVFVFENHYKPPKSEFKHATAAMMVSLSKDSSSQAMMNLSIEQHQDLFEQGKGYKHAIAIFYYYQENRNPEMAFHWLRRAIDAAPNDTKDVQKFINLYAFLKPFSTLYAKPYLFQDKYRPLLDILKNSVTKVNIDDYYPRNYVNSNLTAFIAESHILTSLDLTGPFYSDNDTRLTSSHMKFIADGLKVNTSLKKLRLENQPIGDEGLRILLDALNSNPAIHLEQLDLRGTNITEKGYLELTKYMETYPISCPRLWIHTDLNISEITAKTARTCDVNKEGNASMELSKFSI